MSAISSARSIGFERVLEALRQDYALRGKLSPQSSSHLDRVDFGEARAIGLTAEQIDNYVSERVQQGDAASSINRACQLLGQGYKLAIRRGHLTKAPAIRHLSEVGNERQSFLDVPEFRTLCSHLPDDGLRDFCLFRLFVPECGKARLPRSLGRISTVTCCASRPSIRRTASRGRFPSSAS